jgi:regulator of sigma E protease
LLLGLPARHNTMTAAQILLAVLGLSVLVIVHEAGHYFAARAFGMRVLRFSVGFGPILLSYKPRNSPTTFQVSALPFGAYVMIAGMNPVEEFDPDDPELYPNKGVFARFVTIFAGPFANYLAASVMVLALAVTHGWADPDQPAEPMTVAYVVEDSPASAAGVEPNDVIVAAEGKPIKNVTELIEVTKPRAGKPTSYVIVRDGKRLDPITITPMDRDGKGVIGVQAMPHYSLLPLSEAAVLALEYPAAIALANVGAIVHMIEKKTTKDLAGPVKMGEIVAEEAGKGVFYFVNVLVAISVALGFFNLLPIPGLDGGRLAFLGYEVVTRRRPDGRVEAVVHAVGLIFLLGVITLVTFRDIWG